MAKNPHTHTLKLTQAQFDAVAEALEFANRFASGQIDVSNLPSVFLGQFVGVQRYDVDHACNRLKRALFPNLAEGESLGVGHQPGDHKGYFRDTLYEVYRTMLEHRTEEQHKAGQDVSHSVYKRPGLQYTNEAKPVIEAVDPTEAKKAFIDKHFPKDMLRKLHKAGQFPLTKPTYEEIEAWVCKRFKLDSLFDYETMMDGAAFHLSLARPAFKQPNQDV